MYFKWIGIDIVGTIKKGKRAAFSSDDLSRMLLQHDIALIWCKPLHVSSLVWPVHAKTKSDLLAQISQLLRAGVLLPSALFIVAEQSRNPIIHDALFTIARDIENGVSIHKAIEQHSFLHDPIVAVMLVAGNESGDMIHAIECITHYFENNYLFNKNLRAVLVMPFLTLLFFIGISFFIFVVIVPRFADMLQSMQQELPPLTQCIINISEFLCSVSMVYVAVLMTVGILGSYRYFQTTAGKKRWNYLINNVPFMGTIIWQQNIGQAFYALALLIKSGIPLVDALKIVSDSVGQDMIKEQFMTLYHDVGAGQLLSKAMSSIGVFLPEVIALVHVGQESGTMGHSLQGVALVYTNKVEESLKRFVFFLQPMVIIVLGLLVTTLIFAVYAPIMQLSNVL